MELAQLPASAAMVQTLAKNLASAAQDFSGSQPSWVLSILAKPKTRFIFLQILVTIILSYELLLSPNGLISPVAEQALSIGLWLLAASLFLPPPRFFHASWFPGSLLVADTLLTVVVLYLSGNASSHLYVAFFLLILLAGSIRSLTQMLSLSLVVCAGYGFLIYQGVLVSGDVSVGHLLGIPVLLVMAVFYGLTLESLVRERGHRVALQERVSALRWEEEQLRQTRDDLEAQIRSLKQQLGLVTQEAHAGRMRQKGLETRLQRAQKMEAVARLAGVVAKDFNLLFRAIGIQTREALKKVDRDDGLRRHLERILAAGDRASVLTGQLQLFSKDESFRPEAVPLNGAIEQLQAMLEGLLREDIVLRTDLDPSIGFVKADRGQLEIVIMNLVVNARDAMRQGGEITIETRHVRSEDVPRFESDAPPDQQYVQLSVADNGCGLSKEVEARLFEPFSSTKGQAAGNGLATVYGIVRRSGGFIEVKSQPGRGTICELYLATMYQGRRVATGGTRQRLGPGVNKTVLLVEDDEMFRKLCLSALQRQDYHVLEARTAVEALLIAHRFIGTIDVVISNAMMHDINGRELTDRLLTRHPGVKILYMGGYTDDMFVDINQSESGFLQKPCTQNDVVEKVREVLSPA